MSDEVAAQCVSNHSVAASQKSRLDIFSQKTNSFLASEEGLVMQDRSNGNPRSSGIEKL